MENMHMMVDVETLGTGTFPALLSIGAIVFNPHNDYAPLLSYDYFYRRVDVDSCLFLGAKVDFKTLSWWMTSDDVPRAARLESFSDENRAHVSQVMADWVGFCQASGVERIWSNGISFDICILMRYLEKLKFTVNFKWPVSFRGNRDTRTIWELVPESVLEITDYDLMHGGLVAQLPKHHPVFDCWKQARRVQKAYKFLKPKGLTTIEEARQQS